MTAGAAVAHVVAVAVAQVILTVESVRYFELSCVQELGKEFQLAHFFIDDIEELQTCFLPRSNPLEFPFVGDRSSSDAEVFENLVQSALEDGVGVTKGFLRNGKITLLDFKKITRLIKRTKRN